MAITIKPNQALAFTAINTTTALDGCGCNTEYCQPVQSTDIINLQGTVNRTGNNLVGDSNTWGYEEGWNFNILSAQPMAIGYNITNPTSKLTTNSLGLKPNRLYEFYFDIRTKAVLKTSTTTFFDDNRLTIAYVNFQLAAGDKFTITGTGYNDGTFTVVSTTYFTTGTTGTEIVVAEPTVAELTSLNIIHTSGNFYQPLPNEGYRIKINGSYVALPVNNPDTQNQRTSQSYQLRYFFEFNSIASDVITIECTTPLQEIYVNEISVFEISRVGTAIYKGDEWIAQYDNPAGLHYVIENDYALNPQHTEQLPFKPVLWSYIIEVNQLFDGLTGCYRLSLFDNTLVGYNYIKNGTFSNGFSNWSASNYWSASGGTAAYSPPVAINYTGGKLSQTIQLTGGTKYYLNFSITGTSNFLPAVRVSVRINGGAAVTLGDYYIGLFSVGLINLNAYSGLVTVEVIFSEANPHIDFAIDTVVVIPMHPDRNNLSNCINVQPTHDCTLMFNAYNYDNAFGFTYTNTSPVMQHFLRVKAKMDVTAYPEETETPYIFSNNNRVLMFARRDKEYTVFITDAPDHIHDCLSHMRLHDEFKIGTGIYTGLQFYVKESAYELNRRKTSSLKQATFTVREKQGIAGNFPCG